MFVKRFSLTHTIEWIRGYPQFPILSLRSVPFHNGAFYLSARRENAGRVEEELAVERQMSEFVEAMLKNLREREEAMTSNAGPASLIRSLRINQRLLTGKALEM
ncbi:hypothetical protein FOZ62_027899 [Perkinsus olseni]|uniref:Uncharacterized protein n=1 Tax=Perkinsus olseni TaxID=32597 RepID=A0A7J6R9Z6_PEROL|nr:hypothetical protein FOZ62_027899 [Perkinsus olseni]